MSESQAGPDGSRFDADTTSVRAARRFVLERFRSPERAADAALLTSELATNAVLHARTPFSVRVLDADGGQRVEVRDGSPVVPEPLDRGPDALTGRGLRIVATVADRWGVVPTPDGKVVWFELDGRDGTAARSDGG